MKSHDDLMDGVEPRPAERGNPLLCLVAWLLAGLVFWGIILKAAYWLARNLAG